tara:strand:- start:2505 stop:3926 length:1422 start_codon:yes stop_codon:yes gene_type:complete
MRFLHVLLILTFFFTLIFSCDFLGKEQVTTEEKVAQTYCSSCHLYTPPHLLDKASWQKVLPIMKKKIELTGQIVPKEDWNTIYHYYYSNAPFSLTLPSIDTQTIDKIKMNLTDSLSFESIPPFIISMVEDEKHNLVIGTLQGDIYSGSFTKKDTHSASTDLLPIQVKIRNDSSLIVLNMGELGPHHEAKGSIVEVSNQISDTLIENLHRPIHFTLSDLDKDQNEEYIISQFGSTNDNKETGGLWLYEKGSFEPVQISSFTGASKSIVTDLDKDGLDDIVALFSQGDEKIVLYKNEGELKFTQKILLRFHPLYGCLDFTIDDINEDGKDDILLVNGDNADYSPVFKPYHGFRVFQQTGQLEFEEKIFHHINGAAKILTLTSDENKVYGIFSLYPDLYTRPWETMSFIAINSNFDSKRYYTTELTGSNWVISNVDQKGSLTFGKNLKIQKNIPSIRSDDPLKNFSAVRFEVHFNQ